MPELPEVETTRRGIEPHIVGQRIQQVRVRNRGLRWPVPDELESRLTGLTVLAVERRGKYLLFRTDGGVTMIVHLGMSGSLSLATEGTAGPYDHLDWLFSGGARLRMRDPRRFGAVLLAAGDPREHPLLRDLGPEPFDPAFSGEYLYRIAKTRRVAVKQLLMDAKVVVGVGNIYANEALFRARIDPSRRTDRLRREDLDRLLAEVRAVLREAIAAKGTTLRDYRTGTGEAGSFQGTLQVYGRGGLPCVRCGASLATTHAIDGRATTFCYLCQGTGT